MRSSFHHQQENVQGKGLLDSHMPADLQGVAMAHSGCLGLNRPKPALGKAYAAAEEPRRDRSGLAPHLASVLQGLNDYLTQWMRSAQLPRFLAYRLALDAKGADSRSTGCQTAPGPAKDQLGSELLDVYSFLFRVTLSALHI